MFKYNICVIVLDSVRADHVSCYGYERHTTPNLDQLASRGILFDNAVTCATHSVPSHMTLLSGLYPREHKLERFDGFERLDSKIELLPSILRKQGYVSAFFSQNPLLGPRSEISLDFDFYGDFIQARSHMREGLNRWVNGLLRRSPWRDTIDWVGAPNNTRDTFLAVDSWIRSIRSQSNFFILMNLMNVHTPHDPPLRILRRFRQPASRKDISRFGSIDAFLHTSGLSRVSSQQQELWFDLYDSSLAALDEEIGIFFQSLSRQILEETVFIILADHGEMLGEHGGLVGHGFCVYDELIHIPLLIIHPDHTTGKRSALPIQTRDLFFTMAAIAGANLPDLEPKPNPCFDLEDLDMTNSKSTQWYTFSEYRSHVADIPRLLKANPELKDMSYVDNCVAVRTDRAKYIWHENGQEEFYDLKSDPKETRNLVCMMPVEMNEYRAAFIRWRDSLTVYHVEQTTDGTIAEDPMVIERLRALGYVD